jgi:hypothetical protein
MTRADFNQILKDDKSSGAERLRLSKLLAQEQMRTQKDIEGKFFQSFQEG